MAVRTRRSKSSPAGLGMSRRKIAALRTMAEERGLLAGKTHVVRGRMPESLLAAARSTTGIESDTELIKLALANLALEDNYGEWLLSQRGTVSPAIDLEF